ncbi:transposase [Sinimarinibacterium flocculans]|nr:transposase [Sinimarinibacterium flocculans]
MLLQPRQPPSSFPVVGEERLASELYASKRAKGRKSTFSPDEITGILRMMDQGRYASVADLCAFHGISRQTYYNWQAKYGNKAVLALRVDVLEAEIRRLKEIVYTSLKATSGS